MKKKLNEIFDEAAPSELDRFSDELIAPELTDEVLASVKGKVYAKTKLKKKKKNPNGIRLRLGAIAACFIVLSGCVALLYDLMQNDPIIAHYEGDYTNNSYAAPDPGEYFCFVEVNKAREKYADKNVEFLLAFDIFAGESEVTEEELKAEYQRLADLGYKLYYVEDHWTYCGNMRKRYIPVVVGLFSEEQLVNFAVNEKYGYAFHFETNGDGSPISVDEENIITNITKFDDISVK